jgi:predicted ribosome quality control (RQC) complex YloA/Tae2 family protein
METLTCIALSRELSSALRDTYVHEVEQADAGETLMLHMKPRPGAGKRPGWVVLSSCGGAPALFFSFKKPEIDGRAWPTPLSEALERLLVRSVAHRGMDRCLKITFATSKSAGARLELYVELFAAKPRAYLVRSETKEVIGSFGARMGKGGGTYEPGGAAKGKVDPIGLDAEALAKSVPPEPEQDDLVEGIFGIGRILARESVARAEGPGGAARALAGLISDALKGKPPGCVVGPSKEMGLTAPVPLTFRPTTDEELQIDECRTVNDAVRKSYLACRAQRQEAKGRRSAAQEIRARLKRLRRTSEALDEELAEAGRAGDFRRTGELLLSRMAQIPRGLSEIELPDVESGGAPRVVRLDPRLSPAKNAEAYFKKARKLEKKRELLPRRMAELAEQEDRLRRRLEDVEAGRIETSEDTSAPPGGRRAAKREKWPVGVSPRRFTSSDGWTMYVGKNNKDNEYITFTYAKPNDFWFHAHGVPGSHVVLRREGRKANPSKRCIEETAAAAAYFSKGRTSNTVAVVYTEKRYVRKPRKGKAGTALYSHEQTVMVAPKLPKEEDEG